MNSLTQQCQEHSIIIANLDVDQFCSASYSKAKQSIIAVYHGCAKFCEQLHCEALSQHIRHQSSRAVHGSVLTCTALSQFSMIWHCEAQYSNEQHCIIPVVRCIVKLCSVLKCLVQNSSIKAKIGFVLFCIADNSIVMRNRT